MPDAAARKQGIQDALCAMQSGPFGKAAIDLLEALDYRSQKRLKVRSSSPGDFLAHFEAGRDLNREQAMFDRWQSAEFLFQLTGDEVRNSAQAKLPFEDASKWEKSLYESYVFLAIELKSGHYTRTDLATITRAVNRLFNMPAMVLYKLDNTLTLAVIDRRLHKRRPSQDVLEKVTLIKDIRLANPHRAHTEILHDLHVEELRAKHEFTSFQGLHEAWRKTLDISALNKRFYREIADWYFWALKEATFPVPAGEQNPDTYKQQSIIRLITRLIFCWFLKEKGLIPAELFDEQRVSSLLTDIDARSSTFYKAILQNLFFATLNQEASARKFKLKGPWHFLTQIYFRYRSLMKDPEAVTAYFAQVPFLNGGLFECLDRNVGTKENPKYERIDGFSELASNPLNVPNALFFGQKRTMDLSTAFGDAKKNHEQVRGIIDTLDHYKFTIAENTPIE